MHRFEEPKAMYTCSVCHEDICEGDDYWEIGDYICEHCMDELKKVAGEE